MLSKPPPSGSSEAPPDRPETGILKTGREPKSEFVRKVVTTTGIVIGLLAVVILLWYIVRVLVLIFFSILVAVFLRGLGNWIARWARVPEVLSVTFVIVILVGLSVLSVWFLAPHVQEQVGLMSQQIPRAINELRGFVDHYMGGIGGQEQAGKLLGSAGGLAKQIGKFFSITIEALADSVVVFFLIIYLAYNPELYIRGLVTLVPVRHREEAYEVIETLGSTLQWWLIGRISTMAVVGILSGIGLWLLKIPLALTLGIIAGVLTFIPYVGAIVSAVPPILIALLLSFSHAVYVGFLYLIIHIIEGYILAPLIQERTVFIPPMLMLTSLTAFTILLGLPGLIIATPLTAVSLVLIKKIYIEGMLGDKSVTPQAGRG